MKRCRFLFGLAFICLSFTANFAQSKRAAAISDDTTRKINKRPAETAPMPKPVETEDEPNTTNIERVETKMSIETTETDGEVIRVDTELVSIPVKISDRQGRFIGGLTKESFQIFEDNTPQEIALFSNEQQPFTVALVLDMSYSAKFKAAEIQNAALAFINQLRSNDKVLVVSFDREVHVLSAPTSDRQVLQRAIRNTKIDFGTSLYEAVDLVINEKLKKIGGRKAIVLFTDGVDTSSRKADDFNNLSDALELDALIYPIQYDTFAEVQAVKNKSVIMPPTQRSPIPTQTKSPFPFPLPGAGGIGGVGTMDTKGTSVEEYRKADQYLNDMANRTGGRLYQAGTTGSLVQAFSAIAADLREYYSLGYYPKEDVKTGKKRKIKVRVNQPGAVVHARDGYLVGKEKAKN
jgi:VWFA-related protein